MYRHGRGCVGVRPSPGLYGWRREQPLFSSAQCRADGTLRQLSPWQKHVIYSIGLFDYLPDRVAVAVLNWAYAQLVSGRHTARRQRRHREPHPCLYGPSVRLATHTSVRRPAAPAVRSLALWRTNGECHSGCNGSPAVCYLRTQLRPSPECSKRRPVPPLGHTVFGASVWPLCPQLSFGLR